MRIQGGSKRLQEKAKILLIPAAKNLDNRREQAKFFLSRAAIFLAHPVFPKNIKCDI
jgi:hypothetical protein